MIKIEATGIRFTTIHTRMEFEIAQHPFALFCDHPAFPLNRLTDVIMLVAVIMEPNLLAGTISAVGVAPAGPHVLKGKLGDRLRCPASCASLELHCLLHACMVILALSATNGRRSRTAPAEHEASAPLARRGYTGFGTRRVRNSAPSCPPSGPLSERWPRPRSGSRAHSGAESPA